MKYSILVEAEGDVNKTNIKVKQLNTNEPINSTRKLTFTEMSLILTSTISLLVKIADKEHETKDYELIKTIINHLNDEFISIDSFSDAQIIKK
jgi:hypothetical protein